MRTVLCFPLVVYALAVTAVTGCDVSGMLGIPDDIYESAAEQRYVYSSGSTVDYFGEKVDEAEIVGVLFRAYGEETVDYSIVNGEFFLNHSGDAVFISLDGDSLTLSMEGKDNLVFTRM